MLVIRKASSQDAQLILDIRERSILDGCISHYQQSDLTEWAKCKVTPEFKADVVENYYVIDVGDRTVGTGKITMASNVIDAIFVEPDCTGHGVAKSMLSFLETQLKSYGCKQAKLDATLNAATFYRKQGYIGDSVSTYHSPRGFSLDCVPMLKTL